MEFHRKNHYIPQFYMKNWSLDNKKVIIHRLIVSNKNIKLFEKKSISSLGYYSDLYTDFINGRESDEVERWISKEYETPARAPIEKIRIGSKLDKRDYEILTRFVLLQFVRTPAYFKRNVDKWHSLMKEVMETIKIPNSIEEISRESNEINFLGNEHLTLNVQTIFGEDRKEKELKMEAYIGRGFWLFCMKNTLLSTIRNIPEYKWSIMQAPLNFSWPLSDNPVLLLNYYSDDKYDFGGGWGFEGSEIIMPVTPKHILYTQVGKRNPSYMNVSYKMAEILKRLIIENADELIILMQEDETILNYRSRVVDKDIYSKNRAEWHSWLENQKEIDREYKLKVNQNTV